MCEQYKQRLIYDYERYAEMYHNVDEKEVIDTFRQMKFCVIMQDSIIIDFK